MIGQQESGCSDSTARQVAWCVHGADQCDSDEGFRNRSQDVQNPDREDNTKRNCLESRDFFHQLRRRSDIKHVNLTKTGLGSCLGETDFGRDEGARVCGADRVLGGLAGIAVQAAGNVDGENWNSRSIQLVDDGVERRPGFALGSGAEQGVDDPSCVSDVFLKLVGFRILIARMDRHLRLLQDPVIGCRVTCELGWIAVEEDAWLVAAEVEVSGDDEAVAAVVSSAAADYDGAIDSQVFHPIDDAPASVFHENESGKAVNLHRVAVDLTRLLTC